MPPVFSHKTSTVSMCEVVTEADAVVAIRAGHSMAGRLIFCG